MFFTPIFYGSITIAIILIIITSYAQFKVKSTFNKYNRINTENNVMACDFARNLLDAVGLNNIKVVKVAGSLTDYYDHKHKVVALSADVYNSTTVSALGVAAHEVGHAIQYKEHYKPITVRNILYPIANGLSTLMWPVLIIGIIGSLIFAPTQASMFNIINIIILSYVVMYGISTLFGLLTLPIEINASKRAISVLGETQTLTENELPLAKEVLNAAALTYVASLIVSAVYFLRFLLIFLQNTKQD